jgi:hypothetical protein
VAPDGFRALEAQLRAPVPDGLRALTNDELHELTDAIADAQLHQAKALDIAGEQALRHIPRLLRGPIRKVLR